MLTRNQIRFISDLRHSAHRRETGLYLAEGHRLVADLIHSGAEILAIYARESWLYQHLALCKLKGLAPQLISEQLMGRMTALTTPSPVLAVVKIPEPPVEDVPVMDSLVLLLEDIKDPGNMGTIIRTADWFGVRHICRSRGCVDIYNTKVVQATMGSIIRVKQYEVEPAEWLESLPTGVNVYGTVLNGQLIYQSELARAGVIVIGNEGRGISEEIQAFMTQRLTIPNGITEGLTAESLNAGVAASIVMSEFNRRRLLGKLL
jgi:TrmH family RNA methyltransferase